ncbi:nitrate- and nitrite sensing domain-containing protein [Nocardia sp. alder85J]|uniref:sensor histidine kinase n=1 Tax=Nocardia sp. alder85J TaxID=2862949 RepID=UPI001CD33FD7|nr:nitrate- and nitrite sensing domain-containing protein [Nocardia sp. alder85J]MCX4095653.1 nitrate- and nitrite sensing domain-containing protein [Nocardia sp. alder85J]
MNITRLEVWSRALLTVRARVLVIVLIPSLALFGLGVAGAWILVERGLHARDWSGDIERGIQPGLEFINAAQRERSLSLLLLSGGAVDRNDLQSQRHRLDGVLSAIESTRAAVAEIEPGAAEDANSSYIAARDRLANVRTQIDTNGLSIDAADQFYTQLVGISIAATESIELIAPDPATAVHLTTATGLANVVEAMSHSNALAAAGTLNGPLSAPQFSRYSRLVDYYHAEVDSLSGQLTADEHRQLEKLETETSWQQLSQVEDALLQHGAGGKPVELPITTAEWQSAAETVNSGLLELWKSHVKYAMRFANDSGTRTMNNSLLGGGVIVILATFAFGIALWLSDRLVRRLRRLRNRTLALAEDELPDLMRRAGTGKPIDLDAEVAELDFGRDEIGQVANAFSRAHRAAVAAAVAEAKTREGVRAVFLNIAHRSQLIVHQQLALLDGAENQQEDPVILDVLFQLDQLATRGRRNAENLIILGGERPGRQWRNPVALLEIARSAVGETEGFARVRFGRVPEVRLAGTAVADLIHLLAELIDNATSFSPPNSRVEISGSLVGRGVALEIMDQGLGMPQDDLDRINAMLSRPPDFGIAELSSDSRLGMFVVARLAARHGVGVRLAESDYGGIRAIVLIPTPLVVQTDAPEQRFDDPTPTAVRWSPPAGIRPDDHDYGHAADPGPSRTRSLALEDARRAIPAEPVFEPPAQHRTRGQTEPPDQPDWLPGDGRPPLPRRRRQASLAPQLADSEPPSMLEPTGQAEDRSPDDARNRWSAIATGTKQGRHPQTPGQRGHQVGNSDERKNNGDFFPRH